MQIHFISAIFTCIFDSNGAIKKIHFCLIEDKTEEVLKFIKRTIVFRHIPEEIVLRLQ